MKSKILDALKTKFEGVEEKILDKLAVKLAKTVKTDDDVKTAVDGVTFQDVLTSYGDARANDAQVSAVKNYEKKHGLKDGKKVKTSTDDDDDEDDDPDEPAYFKKYRKSMQEQLDAIKAENEAIKAEKAKNERALSIKNKAKELGIPEFLMKRFSIADDADIDAELTAYKQELVTNSLLPEKSGAPTSTSDAQLAADADAFVKQFTQNK